MTTKREEAIERLRDLIKGIDICMLTTNDAGVLRSRPMSTQDAEFDGTLWFFTDRNTHKVDEIQKDDRVNVSYIGGAKTSFVSVSGTAKLIRDQKKIDEYWKASHSLWFPKGKDDPDLHLLKVEVDQAEYWEISTGTIVHLLSTLKTLVTGAEPDDSGDSKKITL